MQQDADADVEAEAGPSQPPDDAGLFDDARAPDDATPEHLPPPPTLAGELAELEKSMSSLLEAAKGHGGPRAESDKCTVVHSIRTLMDNIRAEFLAGPRNGSVDADAAAIASVNETSPAASALSKDASESCDDSSSRRLMGASGNVACPELDGDTTTTTRTSNELHHAMRQLEERRIGASSMQR